MKKPFTLQRLPLSAPLSLRFHTEPQVNYVPASREAGIFHIDRVRLSNGLRVWVKERPGTGTVFLVLQVLVGSRHETKDNNGISHFVEHMLFTGTAKWSEQEVVETVRRRGGEANAHTGAEDTDYWLHLQANDLDFGLEWLEEVVFRPELLEDKFKKERQIIVEEKGGALGRLEMVGELIEDMGWGWNVFRAVQHRLFPQSSLLFPTIGFDRSLGRLTHAQIVDFYRQHYVPNNMTLIVVGDVKAADVVECATRHLAAFAAGPQPPRPATPLPPEGGFNLRLRGPNLNNQGQLLLGAPLPGLKHPDRWALTVLAEILHTRLTQDIRFKRGLVYGVDVYPAMYTDVGHFVVYTTADTHKFGEILDEVEGQLERAIRGEIEPSAVDEAKTAIRGRMVLSLEGTTDLGWWLSELSLFLAEEAQVPDLFAEVEAVTAPDLARVAGQYLTREKRYQAVHRPGLTPERLARPALIGAGLTLAGLGAWLWARRQRRNKRKRAAH